MVSQYGGSAGVSFAADLLNAYNQRDYNLINTQMDPIMKVAGSMNPLVGQLQQRAELEQLKYNTLSSAFNPTAPTPGYTVSSTPYNYANPLLNAAGQIYALPKPPQPSVLIGAPILVTAPPIVLTKPAVQPPPKDPAAAAWFDSDTTPDKPDKPECKGGFFKRLANWGKQRSEEAHERNAERHTRKHDHKPGEGHGHGHCHKK